MILSLWLCHRCGFTNQKCFLDMVMWPSWWCHQVTSHFKGYTQCKFQVCTISRSWKRLKSNLCETCQLIGSDFPKIGFLWILRWNAGIKLESNSENVLRKFQAVSKISKSFIHVRGQGSPVLGIKKPSVFNFYGEIKFDGHMRFL